MAAHEWLLTHPYHGTGTDRRPDEYVLCLPVTDERVAGWRDAIRAAFRTGEPELTQVDRPQVVAFADLRDRYPYLGDSIRGMLREKSPFQRGQMQPLLRPAMIEGLGWTVDTAVVEVNDFRARFFGIDRDTVTWNMTNLLAHTLAEIALAAAPPERAGQRLLEGLADLSPEHLRSYLAGDWVRFGAFLEAVPAAELTPEQVATFLAHARSRALRADLIARLGRSGGRSR